jgi:hypothetical protein
LSETSKTRLRPEVMTDLISRKRPMALSCLAVGGGAFEDNSAVHCTVKSAACCTCTWACACFYTRPCIVRSVSVIRVECPVTFAVAVSVTLLLSLLLVVVIVVSYNCDCWCCYCIANRHLQFKLAASYKI